MSAREEIRNSVEDFRKFHERSATEREARINTVNQGIVHTRAFERLEAMYRCSQAA